MSEQQLSTMKRVYLVGFEEEVELLRKLLQQLELLRRTRSKFEVEIEVSQVTPTKRSLGKYQLPRLVWPS